MKRTQVRWGVLIAIIMAAGCGASAPPAGRVASARAAIRAAEEMGAGRTPKAALHLKYARDQYAEAQRFARDDEPGRAALLLRRAEADADLALALAKQAAAEREAQAAAEELESTRENP